MVWWPRVLSSEFNEDSGYKHSAFVVETQTSIWMSAPLGSGVGEQSQVTLQMFSLDWMLLRLTFILLGGFKALTGRDWEEGSWHLLWGERWSITHIFTHVTLLNVWEIKEEFFHAYCTFFCSVMSLISQLKGPLDHSHFDMFPPELEEPPDELSGWDKDFWERVISARILFCKYF